MPKLPFALIAAALVCTACASAPDQVREQARSDLRCNSSELVVNRTKAGGYLRDDRYEAEGCGQRATYACDKAYVLMIPAGTMSCSKTPAESDSKSSS